MKILLVGNTEEQASRLRAMFPTVAFQAADPTSPPDSAQAVIGFTRNAFDRIFLPKKIAQMPSVRWYHAPGAGIEDYLFPGLADASFVLTNGKIIQGPEVADHALALLLALTRRLNYAGRGVPFAEIPRPVELNGKTLLVIGAGGIGLPVAERAAAFGMRVEVATEDNVPFVSFVAKRYLADELLKALPTADAVIVAAPVTKRSHRMMNAAAFAAMKIGAYFVNVSRGATTDTEALWEALAAKRLAGVGLDVIDPEPLAKDHPLLRHPDAIVSPHLAGISDNLRERNFDLISTNIRRFVAGLPLINVVDKVRGF